MQPLGDIEEVNMFKDDNTVIHFKRPQGKYQVLFVSFTPFDQDLSSSQSAFMIVGKDGAK